MHPYFIDREAQTRWDTLHRLAIAAAPPERPPPASLRERLRTVLSWASSVMVQRSSRQDVRRHPAGC